jgi:transaldolase/glucose-6-phosphate isomerase
MATTKNPLAQLTDYGQSPWFDNISRDLVESGDLKRMVEEDGLRGVTSNPTIFEKAITGSESYKKDVQALLCEGKSVNEIYETLAVRDIQAAADVMRPVYDASGGTDGFVSLEVSPNLAHDTAGTVAEAKKLHARLGRPNVMIKVPATPAGLPAIEQLIAAGICVNVTLIFSIAHYVAVAEAYLRGLEARAQSGQPLDKVASVASVFVSRIDSVIDKILGPNPEAQDYVGKAAIANAKVIYGRFKGLFGGERFAKLKRRGAQVQRPLWASTGVKNPKYSDVLYAEAVIGPDTVDTMPPATMNAFRDHGVAASRLPEGIDEAGWFLAELPQFGVDLEAITQDLQKDGVDSFVASFVQLMKGIETQGEGAVCDIRKASVVRYRPWLAEVYKLMDARGHVRRIWEKDPTLWHHQPHHHAIIRSSLGWLGLPQAMKEKVGELKAFADEVRSAGFQKVVLLGMGGSALIAEVWRQTFGVKEGCPDLVVLDTTYPGIVARCKAGLDPAKTLFVVSSKSGGTVESAALLRLFHDAVRQAKGDKAGENFVAITDPGSPLERLAGERGFRRTFLNPRDIAGRYGALSYTGLVPAALLGVDVGALLASAERMADRCRPGGELTDNLGAQLGAIVGELAHHGRDKLTLVLSPSIASFGSWAEQLVSESLGKEGRGVLLIDGEKLGGAAVYGRDRVFVSLEVPGDEAAIGEHLERLEAAGHPTVRITIPDRIDLGGEFFRWEFATATAAALLGVDPFDQPDVQESKDNTRRLMQDLRSGGKLPAAQPGSASEAGAFVGQAREFDYVAILAYVGRTAAAEAALDALREKIRDRFRVATTVGFGPRFLHSTGQYHKGGPNNGLFLYLTADDGTDVPIPGEPYSLSALKRAQALGDLESLRRKHRRVLHLDLGKDVEGGIGKIAAQI